MNILLIRSAPLPQCLALFRFLKEVRYPSGVRWFWIVQPSVEQEVRDASEGVESVILVYDRSRMSYGALKSLFLERLRRERIDEAYVPFNNIAGRGYGGIIRFLSAAGVARIVSHVPVKYFRHVTWKSFVVHRILQSACDMAGAVMAALSLPFVLLYHLYVRRCRNGRFPESDTL